jgi:tetratricopeptide (TPR) repeat protein
MDGRARLDDALRRHIESDPARRGLAEWAEEKGISLSYAEWAASGFTNAQLIGVHAHEDESRDTNGMIVKIDVSDRREQSESSAQRRAIRAPKGFVDDHLVAVVHDAWSLRDGGWITFQGVAGGGFDQSIGFHDMLGKYVHPDECCAAVIRSLLTGWNTGTPSGPPMSAATLLRELLGDRILPRGVLHEWAQHTGLLERSRPRLRGDLINPFALALDDRIGGGITLRPFRGHSHGDLHPGNLLVAKEEREPAGYWLVDLSRHRADGLLTWDPCYLMCTTAAMRLHDGIELDRDKLRDALLTPEIDARRLPSRLPPELRKVIAGIYQAEHDHAKGKSLLDQWQKQRLVCLTAISLILSGRALLRPRERQWFFWLGAHAATELLRLAQVRVPPDDPLDLPGEFIPLPAMDLTRTRREPSTGTPVRPATETPPVNHDDVREALRRRLVDGPWGVVVVTGPRGVGKSTLVRTVLDGLSPPRPRIYRTPPVEGLRLDVKTLVDCVEGSAASTPRPRRGESSPARLEAALDAAGEDPVVIVVENAERLLRPDHALADLELDEAFESLATRPGHRVSVVLVSGVTPLSPAGGTWPATEPPVAIGRLRLDDFAALLRDRHGGLPGPRDLDAKAVGTLYRALQGNPRLTILFHAARVLGRPSSARTLVEELSCLQPKEVPETLLDLLVDGLDPHIRRVLECLAAYRFPVTEEQVLTLTEQPEEEVANSLALLTESLLVRRSADRYDLMRADADWILERMPETGTPAGEGRLRLLHRAANQLTSARAEKIHAVGDLDAHFAELRALIGARKYPSAYEMVEVIHDTLREWNSGFLLIDDREVLRGKLESGFLEMANDNALGGAYASRARFSEATVAYDRALGHAQTLGDDLSAVRIRANSAAMHWQNNDVREAHRLYEKALAGATRLGDPVARMGALEGLADCHRRWGQYADAIRLAQEAFAGPAGGGYPDDARARRSAARKINLALKLSRWYAELDLPSEADEKLQTAERELAEGGDRSHQAAVLDGRADLHLYAGKPKRAAKAAVESVALAFPLHDPVMLTQARTTLCMAYLERDLLEDAEREIEAVERYRRPGRSLVVLALLALVARKTRRFAVARKRSERLHAEADHRIRRDEQDFAAWDFRAYATCFQVLGGEQRIDDAVRDFTRARELAPGADGLAKRLAFLVRQLDACGHPRDQLMPAILALSSDKDGG